MADNGKTADDRIVAALLRARFDGIDSERDSAAIAALTERLSKARPSKVNTSNTDDDLIAAAELLRDGLTDTDSERNFAAVEALIERLRKAHQLKTALEAHFQTATPSTAANTDTRTTGAENVAQDTSARGPATFGRSDVGSAPRTPSAASKSIPFGIAIVGLAVICIPFAMTFADFGTRMIEK